MAANIVPVHEILKHYGSAGDVYASVINGSNYLGPAGGKEDLYKSGFNLVKAMEPLIQLIRETPSLGWGVSAGALVITLNDAKNQLDDNGYIYPSTAWALVADTAGVLSTVAAAGVAAAAAGVAVVGGVTVSVPFAIIVAGLATVVSIAAGVYGNTVGRTEKKAELALIAKWGTDILAQSTYFKDYQWSADDQLIYAENYAGNPSLTPALQVLHAFDKNLSLDACLALIDNSGVGSWSQGGKLGEASRLLSAIYRFFEEDSLPIAANHEQ
jgi:hypothetical protein